LLRSIVEDYSIIIEDYPIRVGLGDRRGTRCETKFELRAKKFTNLRHSVKACLIVLRCFPDFICNRAEIDISLTGGFGQNPLLLYRSLLFVCFGESFDATQGCTARSTSGRQFDDSPSAFCGSAGRKGRSRAESRDAGC